MPLINTMNLQEIKKRIIKKATVNKQFYTDEDMLFDINREYKRLWKLASLSGLGIPRDTEEITITKGQKEFDRQIKTLIPVKVEFKGEGRNDYICLELTEKCKTNECQNIFDLTYTFDNEKIMLSNDKNKGTLKITYPRVELTELVNDTDEPDIFLKEWEDLLWLKPVVEQTFTYKPERYEYYANEYQTLLQDFKAHYQVKEPKQFVKFKNNFKR